MYKPPDMIEAAYIQTHPQNPGLPLNDTAYTLWFGCWSMGIETRFYSTFEEIQDGVSPNTLVHGGVGNVLKALKHLGAPDPNMSELPQELLPWYGRKVWTSTIAEVQKRASGPVFIKPLKSHKAFDGHVVTDAFRTLIYTAAQPPELEVLCSEVVRFVSEYRCMVHHGILVACRHYRGDFTVTPDFEVVLKMIRAFTSASVGYSLDVGVTDDGRTLVVEVNDAFSLGAYGTPAMTYTNMVVDRWKQMTEACPSR